MSTFILMKERVVKKRGDEVPLVRKRSEGRMKNTSSVTDRRAWCLDKNEWRQYFLELIAGLAEGKISGLGQLVPVDVIIDTLMAEKNAEIDALTKNIAGLNEILDKLSEQLSPEQKKAMQAMRDKVNDQVSALRSASPEDREGMRAFDSDWKSPHAAESSGSEDGLDDSSLKTILNKKDSEILALKNELAECQTDSGNKDLYLMEAMQKLENCNEILNTNKDLQDKLYKKDEKLKALQDEKDRLKKDKDQAMAHIKALESGKGGKKGDLAAIEKEMNKVGTGTMSPQEELALLKKEMEKLKNFCKDMAGVEEERDMLAGKAAQLESLANDLKNENIVLEKQKKTLQDQLEGKGPDAGSSDNVSALKNKIMDMEGQLKLLDGMKKERDNLVNENVALKKQAGTGPDDLKKELKKYKDIVKDLERKEKSLLQDNLSQSKLLMLEVGNLKDMLASYADMEEKILALKRKAAQSGGGPGCEELMQTIDALKKAGVDVDGIASGKTPYAGDSAAMKEALDALRLAGVDVDGALAQAKEKIAAEGGAPGGMAGAGAGAGAKAQGDDKDEMKRMLDDLVAGIDVADVASGKAPYPADCEAMKEALDALRLAGVDVDSALAEAKEKVAARGGTPGGMAGSGAGAGAGAGAGTGGGAKAWGDNKEEMKRMLDALEAAGIDVEGIASGRVKGGECEEMKMKLDALERAGFDLKDNKALNIFDEMEKLRMERDAMMEERNTLRCKAGQAIARMEALQAERDAMKLDRDSLRNKASDCITLEQKYNAMRSERDALQKKLDEVSGHNLDIKCSNLKVIVQERDMLRKKLKEFSGRDSEMERLQYKGKEAEVLRTERDRMKVRLDELESIECAYLALLEKTRNMEVVAAERDMYKEKYDEISVMESEMECLRCCVDNLKSVDKDNDVLKRQVKELQCAVADQEDEIKRLLIQVDRLSVDEKQNMRLKLENSLDNEAKLRFQLEQEKRSREQSDHHLGLTARKTYTCSQMTCPAYQNSATFQNPTNIKTCMDMRRKENFIRQCTMRHLNNKYSG